MCFVANSRQLVLFSLSIISLFCGFLCLKKDVPIVKLRLGYVEGQQLTTSDPKKDYFAFRGIPYAKPPIGNLRFEPPVPVEPWDTPLSAVKDAPPCMQGIIPTGSEDCLYLNVYTPELNKKALMPVMVWIHGGYFIFGDGSFSSFGPDNLIVNNVIVVTMNYRLGVFGFLSTQDDIVPGNYGLKDQLLALQWVKENIGNFGGDPDSITVFGESAGAVSISYIIQSKFSEGLFQRAILQSGTTLNLWGISKDPKEIAYAIGGFLRANKTSSESLIKDLRNVSAFKLQLVASSEEILKSLSGNLLNGVEFGPCVEHDHEGAIITGRSHEKLKAGNFTHIPVIIGYNSEEGEAFDNIYGSITAYALRYDLNPKELIPASLNLVNDSVIQEKVVKYIKQRYFNWSPVALNQKNIKHFLTANLFIRPIREYAKLFSLQAPVHFYRFSYEGKLGKPNRKGKGVGHAEEVSYLWKRAANPEQLLDLDELTCQRLAALWTNFAKYSNPTPEEDAVLEKVIWPLYDSENEIFLDIGRSLAIETHPNSEDVLFWDELFNSYGNPPYSTY